MITIDLSEVSALAPHVQPGSHEPVILTHGGQAVAAVFPASEEDVADLLLSVNSQFQTILARSQRRFELEGGMSSAEVRRSLGCPAGIAAHQTNELEFQVIGATIVFVMCGLSRSFWPRIERPSRSGLRSAHCSFPRQLSCERLDGSQRVGPVGQPAVNSTDPGGTDAVAPCDGEAARIHQP